MRSFAIAVTVGLMLPAVSARADCCAGGHVDYLVYGSQFGYGGGAARGRTVQPFAGVANPRYASTQHIGGPMGHAASHQFVQQVYVRPQQWNVVANRSTWSDTQFVSDADLFQPPTDDEAQDTNDRSEVLSPDYPGQPYDRLGAVAGVPQQQHEAADEVPQRGQPEPRMTSQSRSRSRTARPTRGVATGAFASDSAARIARQMRAAGLDF